jgi:hypothetical protein
MKDTMTKDEQQEKTDKTLRNVLDHYAHRDDVPARMSKGLKKCKTLG